MYSLQRYSVSGGVCVGVGEADLDIRDAMGVGIGGRRAMEYKGRGTAGRMTDFQIEPVGMGTDAGTQCFGNRLLGGKTCGVMDRGGFFGAAVCTLGGGEETGEEGIAMARGGRGDAGHFHHVDADAVNNHLAAVG